MTHPVRHSARRRVPVSGADTKNFSERGASMQTPDVNQTAWNGNSRGFAWDHLKLAHAILDPEALEILRSSSTGEMTANELSRRCGMSTGRTYRWLRRLESIGLVVSREGGPQRRGVPSRRYRSALQSISVSLAEDQIRTRIEVNEGSIPVVSECMTMVESSDTPPVPRRRSHRRRVGAERIHFIDPPATTGNSRGKLPINLPAFLEEPLSRLPERR
jgi:DNA-binding transcriptional ArsR family regulator